MNAVGGPTAERIYRRNMAVFPIVKIFQSCIFLIPVWVAYERQFLNFSQFTAIEAIIFGTQLVFELPTGALADLWGKRLTVFFGFFVFGLSEVLYSFAHTYPVFILYAIIMGIGSALISGAEEALLYDSLKEAGKEHEFGKKMSGYNLIFQFGLAFSAVIGGYLGSRSYYYPIYLTALFSLIASIATLWFIEPHVDTEKFTLPNYIHQTRIGAMELVKTDHVKKISLFYILVGGITWVCQLVFNSSILTDLHYSTTEFGWTMAFLRIFNSIVLFKLLRIGDFLNRSRVFLMFPLVMSASLLPGIFFTKWTAIPFIAGAMFSSTARWSILGEYTNKEFESKNRATAISTLSMGVGIIYIITTLFSGPVMQWYGGARIMFTILGVVSVMTVLPLGIHLAKQHKQNLMK